MISLKKIFYFLLIFIDYSRLEVLQYNFVADYHYTYIEVLVQNIPSDCSTYFIELYPLPLFAVYAYAKPFKISKKYSLLQTYFGDKNYKANQCKKIKGHPFSTQDIHTFHIFTSLYNQTQASSYSLSISGLLDDKIVNFANLVNKPIPSNITLNFLFTRYVPPNRTEGIKFYPGYAKDDIYKPHDKGFAFYKEKRPPTIVNIVTLPRSGTHLIGETLQEILKEHVVLIPQPPADILNMPAERPFMHMRIQVSHYTYSEWLSSRLIISYRNPITEIDSLFHNTMNTLDSCKRSRRLSPGYEKIPKYKVWINNQLNLITHFQEVFMELPVLTYYIQFEEMQKNPEKIFCEILSFVNGFPCEFSFKKQLTKLLKEKGMISYYASSKTKKESASEEELFIRYGLEYTNTIFGEKKLHKWMIFFGYINMYEEYIGIEKTKLPEVLEYKIANENALVEVLTYKHIYEATLKNIKIYAHERHILYAMKICEDEAFIEYRNCV